MERNYFERLPLTLAEEKAEQELRAHAVPKVQIFVRWKDPMDIPERPKERPTRTGPLPLALREREAFEGQEYLPF